MATKKTSKTAAPAAAGPLSPAQIQELLAVDKAAHRELVSFVRVLPSGDVLYAVRSFGMFLIPAECFVASEGV